MLTSSYRVEISRLARRSLWVVCRYTVCAVVGADATRFARQKLTEQCSQTVHQPHSPHRPTPQAEAERRLLFTLLIADIIFTISTGSYDYDHCWLALNFSFSPMVSSSRRR